MPATGADEGVHQLHPTSDGDKRSNSEVTTTIRIVRDIVPTGHTAGHTRSSISRNDLEFSKKKKPSEKRRFPIPPSKTLISLVTGMSRGDDELSDSRTGIRCFTHQRNFSDRDILRGGGPAYEHDELGIMRVRKGPTQSTTQCLFGGPDNGWRPARKPKDALENTHGDLFGLPNNLSRRTRLRDEDTQSNLFGKANPMLEVREIREDTQDHLFGQLKADKERRIRQREDTQRTLFGPFQDLEIAVPNCRKRSALGTFLCHEEDQPPTSGLKIIPQHTVGSTHDHLFGEGARLPTPPPPNNATTKRLFGDESESGERPDADLENRFNPITGEGRSATHTVEPRPCIRLIPYKPPKSTISNRKHPKTLKEGADLRYVIEKRMPYWHTTNTITGSPVAYSLELSQANETKITAEQESTA